MDPGPSDLAWLCAWACALVGLLLGSVITLVPGFPGCAVAMLGLAAFAAITDLQIVHPDALLLAGAITAAGSLAQLAGPAAASRALRGSAGAATGAALGAMLGALVPLPGLFFFTAAAGALLVGALSSRGERLAWLRGSLGSLGGCLLAVAADGIAVLGVAAVLGLSDFLAQLGP